MPSACGQASAPDLTDSNLTGPAQPTVLSNQCPSSQCWAGGWRAGSADLDREDRAGGVEEDPLGVAAQDQLADRSTPPQADHDELRVAGLGDADQVLGRLVP